MNISPDLRSVIDVDGAVILDMRRNRMLTLNAVGGYVWQKLEQGQLPDDIIRDLSRETNTDVAVVERDVHQFLEQLKSKRVVDEAEAQRPWRRFRWFRRPL